MRPTYRLAAPLVLGLAALLLSSSCAPAATQTTANTPKANQPPIRGYPRPCGKQTHAFTPLGLTATKPRVPLARQLRAFKTPRAAGDRLPLADYAILELLERTQLMAPDGAGSGRFAYTESRLLQRGGTPVRASLYAVPTKRGQICYAIGPPVIVAQCIEQLSDGISLVLSLRDNSCADAFTASGLTSNDVTAVRFQLAAHTIGAHLARNSFFVVLPTGTPAAQVHAITINYKDKPPKTIALHLQPR